MVILPQTDFKNALEAAKKIKKMVQDFKFTPLEKEITVSIGVASLPDEDIKSVDDMLKVGDDFLYEAKNSGRNRIVGYYSGKKVEID